MENNLEHWIQELLRFVYKHFGRQSIAEDVAQEAVARYLECIAHGQEIEHPRGWIFRTARNLSVDHVRRRLPYQVGLELMQQVLDHYQKNIYYRYYKEVGCAEYAKMEDIKVDAMKA